MGEGSFTGFPKGVIEFLEELKEHNDKVWFDAHRTEYEEFYLQPGRAFTADLADRLTQAGALGEGNRVEGSSFRIFRDTRFSKDKTPYKTHFGVSFGVEGQARHEGPGFYFNLEPLRIGLGAGLHGFSKSALASYRRAVGEPEGAGAVRALMAGAEAQGAALWGKTYKKLPSGFGAVPGDEDLLLYSGLFSWLDVPLPPEVHTAHFLDFCEARYLGLAPLPLWLATLTDGE